MQVTQSFSLKWYVWVPNAMRHFWIETETPLWNCFGGEKVMYALVIQWYLKMLHGDKVFLETIWSNSPFYTHMTFFFQQHLLFPWISFLPLIFNLIWPLACSCSSSIPVASALRSLPQPSWTSAASVNSNALTRSHLLTLFIIPACG